MKKILLLAVLLTIAAMGTYAQRVEIDYRKVPQPQPMYGKPLTFDQKSNAAFAFANGERASTRASVYPGKDTVHALYFNKYHAQFVDLTPEQLDQYWLRVKRAEEISLKKQSEVKVKTEKE